MTDADRIRQLEVALRRAVKVIQVMRPIAMWPAEDVAEDGDPYDEQWATVSLVLIEDALAGGVK